MLRGGDVEEIHKLKRQGLSVSEIARMLCCDRKTVRKYLDQPPEVPQYRRAPRGSKLDKFQGLIEERMKAGVWNAQVLFRELKQHGYGGGYTLVKDYLQPHRQAARTVAVRRFETPPGRQTQLDWGEFGTVEFPGRRQKLYVLVMTLGCSRAMWADLVVSQALPTLLRLHEAGFAALGGLTHEMLYDNMRTVTSGRDEHGQIRWQPLFLDFAGYWGFSPRLCRPYRPQTKGKVERGIRYLRGNFLCGRTASSVDDLREQLRQWLAEVANPRLHGTTYRVVAEAWEEERGHLTPACRPPFPLPEVTARVSVDAHVTYQTNRYAVSWQHAGATVTLREVGDRLEIRHGAQVLRTPTLCRGRHQTCALADQYAGMPALPGGPRGGKTRITIQGAEPTVEVRSLAAYEALAQGADRWEDGR